MDDVDVTPAEALRRHTAGEADLIDVREVHEFAQSRIPGARHVPMDRLATAAPTLDPARPVVFYCRIGGRSRMAADAFRRAGYDAYNLVGGLVTWDRAGLPLEPEGAGVASH